ncbi:MAG: 4-hydroxy-tetrahydrodipicolinate reductase [Endomicrobium sp.]|jgi:4-hydroxy-tetrahydrodipicolinate reductase|nr:4-hydroxy-tetrahydrodipicolinate reductase [Endomicrobium sp.]
MNIVICGAAGKMGQAIISVSKLDSDINIVGALDREHKAINTKNITILPIDKLETIICTTRSVIIDFTNPQCTLNNIKIAKKYDTPIVIGTTGFSEHEKKYILEVAKYIPIVLSPNMSIGMNIVFKLVEIMTRKLLDYNIEIVELHHNSKKDAPSGTANQIADIISSNLGENINDVAIYGRHGTNLNRKKNEIGIFSIRAGDIVGDHTIYFTGIGERLELTHRAHSRYPFAMGALKAAKWLSNKKSHGLYSMADVLDINDLNHIK